MLHLFEFHTNYGPYDIHFKTITAVFAYGKQFVIIPLLALEKENALTDG
jgi:hypothetical protein